MFEPILVYKSPGSQHGPAGKTYSWSGVKTQEDLDDKIADGWFLTLGEAIAPKDAPKIEPKAVEIDENAPRRDQSLSRRPQN
jgi:hypothetical protein